jgi:hypothetical protein
MKLLEEYLDNYTKPYINSNIYINYKKFNYNNEDLFKYHLHFLLDTIYTHIEFKNDILPLNINNDPMYYNIHIKNLKTDLIKKYKKCIITNTENIDELEQVFIINYKYYNDYNINNSLLLSKKISTLFKNNSWCINPDTLKIEVSNNNDNQYIENFNNIKINYLIKIMNPILYINLKTKYNYFIQNNIIIN